jgi:hypothetical protein
MAMADPLKDDVPTVCAMSSRPESSPRRVGHAATALLTGAKSGVLSTVAWSERLRRTACCCGGNTSEPRGCPCFLAGVTQREKCIGSRALSSC